jgi:hypothetical protein
MKRPTRTSRKKSFDVTDSGIVSKVENAFRWGIPYRMTMNSNSLFTYNHISILTAQVLTYGLIFSGTYLGAVYLIRNMGRRQGWAISGLMACASSALILAPALLAVVILVPWATYGNPVLWNNFASILLGSMYGVALGLFEIFFCDGRHFKGLGRLLQRQSSKVKTFRTRDLWRRIPAASVFGRILSAQERGL